MNVHRNRNNKHICEKLIKGETAWWDKEYPYLKKYGYNPAVAPIDCFYKYVSIGYGTHRMAYLAHTSQECVPIVFTGGIESPKFIPEDYMYNSLEYEQLVKIREEYYPRTIDYKVLGFCKEQFAQLVKKIANR